MTDAKDRKESVKRMNKLQKWISLALCACMLMSAAALAEQTLEVPGAEVEVTAAVASTEPEIQDDVVLAVVNGENVTWADVKDDYENVLYNLGSQYDITHPDNIRVFRTLALESQIDETVRLQQAKALGVDQLSAQALAEIQAEADSDWEEAIESYCEENAGITEGSTEEEKAQAKLAAQAHYLELGYTQEILRQLYIKFDIFDRLEQMAVQDVVVTDEDIAKDYQEKVAADKEIYENDINAYIEYNNYVEQSAMYAMMTGSASNLELAWYKPAGFRAVKHILLPVDEALMAEYKELQARLEEQIHEEPEATEAAVAEAATEAAAAQPVVTQADVDAAKAKILSSVAGKVDEISQKVAEGVDFDELIVTYGVKADGTASDPGMLSEPYKTEGYEVASASNNYVPEFVAAALSLNQIGDVSAPYLSDYGVHIVKYLADVPAGPVKMTAAQQQAARADLLEIRQQEAYSEQLVKWKATADIQYTGVILSIAQLEAQYEESVTVDDEEDVADENAEADVTAEPAES